jgi:hypothetical protein
MWERLQRFRRLDPDSRRLILGACVALPLIGLSLAVRGFGATQASLQRFLPSKRNLSEVEAGCTDLALRSARMTRAAARLFGGHFTCLERSLTLWWLLERQGIAANVRIGTRKGEGRFEAHAWVECAGVALDDPGEHEHGYAAFEGELFASTRQLS